MDNNVDKFTGKAKIYNKYRSSYPVQCIDDIIASNPSNKNMIIADIGAGTGKLTELFLKRGIKVIAVEPNHDMINIAKENLSEYGNLIKFNEESAENTKIENNSVDVITVAQAFHWFDKELFKNECKRILKENGTIAIMWNFLDYKKELEGKIIDIQKKYTKLTFNASEEKQRDEDIIQFFGENKYKLKIYENNYLQNYENFIGNQLSMSYSLKESDEKYNEYVSEFKKLFEEFSEDNMVTIHNNTYCYFGSVNM